MVAGWFSLATGWAAACCPESSPRTSRCSCNIAGVFPFVIVFQPLNGFVFALDGVLIGVRHRLLARAMLASVMVAAAVVAAALVNSIGDSRRWWGPGP